MADKALASVRTVFVEKVSREVINQLLDDLTEDGILNEGEKDSILEEHRTRVDRARALIDMVKRKGDVASGKMISRLESRDQTLYNLLRQTGGQSS